MEKPARPAVELAVVVPTFNEIENIGRVYQGLVRALSGVDWEVIVDDDSPDGTADAVRRLAQTQRNVRCVHRIGRRGLSSACLEGALASTAPFVAVMDADMQHDEHLLPAMLDVLRAGETDVVIGSRYVEGGGTGGWSRGRVWISAGATRLAQMMLGNRVTDPLSGFFMARAAVWRERAPCVSAIGFKILLDLLLAAPPHRDLRVRELSYTFREREHGESKLTSTVAWDFLLLLFDKKVGRYVPVQFVSFCLVGSFGVGMHLAVLGAGSWLGLDFLVAHAGGTVTAMTTNFLMNNALTYRERRLRGWRMAAGWLSFCAASSVGVLGNIGAAYWLQQTEHDWSVSALAGILIGTVWNYVATRMLTWRY